MVRVNLGLALHVSIFVIVGLGIWNVFFVSEPNKCDMTYMFEWPEYAQVSEVNKMNNQI